jgi:hypothetical protein
LSGIVHVVPCTKDVSIDNTETNEKPKTKWTPQWTPKSSKQGKIDTSELTPDLAEIVTAWPQLPDTIRSAIVAIVRTSTGKQEG